jgi:coenzyme PQQ precursor peptide PqqA
MSTQSSSSTSPPEAADEQTEARHPLRNSADWATPMIEEFELCMEITAYVYHWQ